MRNLNENIDRLKMLMNINESKTMVKLSDTKYPNLRFDNDGTQNDLVSKALLDDLQAAAESVGVIATITTAKTGHSQKTTTGNESRHMSGEGVDIAILNGVGSGGAKKNILGNKQFRELGDKLKQALVDKFGYIHTGEGGPGHGEERSVGKDVLWRTTAGGNHYNHLHVSNINDTSTAGSPDEDKFFKKSPNIFSSETNSNLASLDKNKLTSDLVSNLTSPGTSNTSDPLLMNILKSVGGIAGLASMTEIKEIDDVYNSINETKKELNKLILKESKVFGSLGNDISYSYGDANIPKNKNTSIKSPVDGTIESISYNANCSTDVIKITHEINNKPHYLTFCGVDPIKVSAGESVSKGTKLGELKDDVKVTLEDYMGNKLPIKSYLNMKNTETNTNKEMEKEVGTVEKRYSDPLLASIVTAPSRLLKGKKDKEGSYEKRWASPTDPSQPSNWISKWSPSKKNPK